jgi:hypothetical protein
LHCLCDVLCFGKAFVVTQSKHTSTHKQYNTREQMLASNLTQCAERVFVHASCVCTFSSVGYIQQLSICIA